MTPSLVNGKFFTQDWVKAAEAYFGTNLESCAFFITVCSKPLVRFSCYDCSRTHNDLSYHNDHIIQKPSHLSLNHCLLGGVGDVAQWLAPWWLTAKLMKILELQFAVIKSNLHHYHNWRLKVKSFANTFGKSHYLRGIASYHSGLIRNNQVCCSVCP